MQTLYLEVVDNPNNFDRNAVRTVAEDDLPIATIGHVFKMHIACLHTILEADCIRVASVPVIIPYGIVAVALCRTGRCHCQ